MFILNKKLLGYERLLKGTSKACRGEVNSFMLTQSSRVESGLVAACQANQSHILRVLGKEHHKLVLDQC